MRYLTLVFLTAILIGCDQDNNTSTSACESPVEFSNQRDATTNGFFVRIDEKLDVNLVALILMNKYSDLEVYSTSPTDNLFIANSGEDTIESLKCEPNITSLQYNNADSVL
jgi:hypothetical protein